MLGVKMSTIQSTCVFESFDDSQIEAFWDILEQVDSTLTSEDNTQGAVKGKTDLQAFISHCS